MRLRERIERHEVNYDGGGVLIKETNGSSMIVFSTQEWHKIVALVTRLKVQYEVAQEAIDKCEGLGNGDT